MWRHSACGLEVPRCGGRRRKVGVDGEGWRVGEIGICDGLDKAQEEGLGLTITTP